MSDHETSGGASEEADEAIDLEHLRSLPKEVGVLLVVIGLGGVLLPGPVGSPFVLMGGVILWPSLFSRFEIYFQKKFPQVHRQSMKQLSRFMVDLEQRYPSRKPVDLG